MAELENKPQLEEDLTYGDIVWGQFKKNKSAYISLWLLVGMFLLAMISPLIANDHPFIWTENGDTSYPWLYSLFDRNYFPNGIDIFFNLLFVFGLPLFLCWWGCLKFFIYQQIPKRKRRKKQTKVTGLLVLVFAGVFLYVLDNRYKEPKKQYLSISENYNIEEKLPNLVTQQQEAFALQQKLPSTENLNQIIKIYCSLYITGLSYGNYHQFCQS